jgi:hypothetical protein
VLPRSSTVFVSAMRHVTRLRGSTIGTVQSAASGSNGASKGAGVSDPCQSARPDAGQGRARLEESAASRPPRADIEARTGSRRQPGATPGQQM